MTVRAVTRGNYAKTPARRQEILEAAFEVFASRGYTNGSLREIAERVGITQAGILFHFASKTGLLQAVLDMRDERSKARFDTTTQPGIDQLRAFLDLVRHNVSEPGIVELYSVLTAEASSEDHPAHTYFRGRYSWILSQAQSSFLTLRDEGALRSGVEPGHAARTMVALVDGLQMQWLYDRDSVDMVADLRTYLQSLVTVAL